MERIHIEMDRVAKAIALVDNGKAELAKLKLILSEAEICMLARQALKSRLAGKGYRATSYQKVKSALELQELVRQHPDIARQLGLADSGVVAGEAVNIHRV